MKRQERIYRNKVAHNFNITDIPLEFSLTYGEMAEAFEAWRKKKCLDEIGEERVYTQENGVLKRK